MSEARPISERATARIGDMPERERRQHLSVLVEQAHLAWVSADATARELKEGKAVIFDEMVNKLLAEKLSKSTAEAERHARTSSTFKSFLRRMHDARTAANVARAKLESTERQYWGGVSAEASARAQMRMHHDG